MNMNTVRACVRVCVCVCLKESITVCGISRAHGVHDDIGNYQDWIKLGAVFNTGWYGVIQTRLIVSSDNKISTLTEIHFTS